MLLYGGKMSSFLGPLGLGRDPSGVYLAFPTAKVGITAEGGFAIKKFNRTGLPTVKGTVLQNHDGYNNSFTFADESSRNATSVVYENNVPNGGECWVIVSGCCEVLLKNSTVATAGYWAKISNVSGRADITTAIPAGGGIPEIDDHFREIGHCLVDVASGTNKLALIFLHFN
jgi:hypothetical protein